MAVGRNLTVGVAREGGPKERLVSTEQRASFVVVVRYYAGCWDWA